MINYDEGLKAFICEDIVSIRDELKKSDNPSTSATKAVVYEEIKDPKTGKTHFSRFAYNSTLIGGTQENACCMWGLNSNSPGYINIKTLDSELPGLLTGTPNGKAKEIFGVLFSKDGASLGTVYPVNRAGEGFSKNGIIPLRMVPISEDSGVLLNKYECRSIEDGYAKYFIKRPTSITLKNMSVDGNLLSHYPNTSYVGVEDVVTAVEMVVDLDIDDMREYFALIEGDVSSRRFNAISLVRGLPVNVNHGGPFIEHRDMIVTQRINGKDRNLEKYNTGKYIIIIYYV